MNFKWKRALAALGSLLVACAVAAAVPGAAQGAAKPEPLKVYVDGTKTQLQAKQVGGKAYISSSSAAALGLNLRPGQNGAFIIEYGNQSVQADKKDTATVDSQLYISAEAVADTLEAKWIEDRLTRSLFLFQQSASASGPIGEGIPPLSPTSGSTAQSGDPVLPAPGGSVTVADALPTLTGIAVEGDAVTISTTGETSPSVFQLSGPDRIVIDLPGTAAERTPEGKAGGTLPIDPNHPYISGVRYSLFSIEPATVRIVLDMKTSAAAFRVETNADGTGIAVLFGAERKRIMIDAGHGGHDPGALSASGKYEKDLTLAVARKTIALLEKEKLLEPVPIRTEDIYSSPAERAQAANNSGIDLYISIHANTTTSSSVSGTETYYWRENSKTLAETIHANIIEAIGSTDRKVKRNNYLVIRETSMPAVLLELGFLSNLIDEKKLYDEQIQDKIAGAIVKSIKQYYGIPNLNN